MTRVALGSSCARVGVIVGAEQAPVEAAVRDLGVVCVVNSAWRDGISSSVRAAVAWAREERADGLVIVLADQPLLTSDHLDRLVAGVRAGAPAAGSGYHEVIGVPAVFAERQFAALAALAGDVGAARVLRELDGVVRVPWPEGAVDVDRDVDLGVLARLERGEAR